MLSLLHQYILFRLKIQLINNIVKLRQQTVIETTCSIFFGCSRARRLFGQPCRPFCKHLFPVTVYIVFLFNS